MTKSYLFILLMLLGEFLFAQPSNAPLRFYSLTVADGLPSNGVSQILQDSRGFMWFSTSQGLARYDGNRFTIYRHSSNDTNSMPYENIGGFTEINNQQLALLSGFKLWLINTVNGQQFPPSAFWRNKIVYKLVLLRQNLLAIQCDDTIYFTDFDLKLIDSVAQNNFERLLEPQLYLGNNEILLSAFDVAYTYSLATKKIEKWNVAIPTGTGNRNFYYKQADTANKILYMTKYSSGAFTMSYYKENPLYLIPQLVINDIRYGHTNDFKKNADIGVIINKNAIEVQEKNNPLKSRTYTNGSNLNLLPGDYYFATTDKAGTYWVAGANGLNRFNLSQINYMYWKLPGTPVTIGRFLNFANTIWLSNEATGSMYLDVSTGLIHTIDTSIINYCWGIKQVKGELYIYGNTTFNKSGYDNVKLMLYNPETEKKIFPDFLKKYTANAELITLIHPAKNGDVWYSLNRGGGLVRQQGNNFIQYTNKDNPPPFEFSYLNNAAEDAVGNIYFSVNKYASLLVWRKATQRFETWKLDSLIRSSLKIQAPVQAHIIDKNQNLWVSVENIGLIKYNLLTQSSKWYKAEDGLQSNSFDCIESDEAGNIWLPTDKGLNCLLAATGKFLLFKQEDGLPFTNFKDAYLHFNNTDTSLYFSKKGYLYKIKTVELLTAKKQSAAKVFIDAMLVNTQPYYFTNEKNIQLSPGQNNLQFSFTLLDIEQSIQQTSFEYYLSRNKEAAAWQLLTGTNTIAFTAMKPGTYTLQVRILNQATGNYIVCERPFTFTIATAWYNTWWFILLVCAGIGLVIWIISRAYYLRRIEKQQAIIEKQQAISNERNRIAADMHDDMGAGLSRMRYLSAAMKKEIDDDNLKNDFDKLITGSDELVDKMNDIIWMLKSGDETLENVLYYIRSQCSEMLDHANINFEYSLPDTFPDKMITSEEKRNLYLVVKEAVHNVIKHSQATKVNLNVQIDKQLKITVADNGKGFNKEENKFKGNGLGNYQKRMAVLKGRFEIESNENGSDIIFEVPVV